MVDEEFPGVRAFLEEFGPDWGQGVPGLTGDDEDGFNIPEFNAISDSEDHGDRTSINPTTTTPDDPARDRTATLGMESGQNRTVSDPQASHTDFNLGAVPQPIRQQHSTNPAYLAQMADQADPYSGTNNCTSGMQSGMDPMNGHYQSTATSYPTDGVFQSAVTPNPTYSANRVLDPAWAFDLQYGYNQTHPNLATRVPNNTSMSSERTYSRLPALTLNNTPPSFDQTSAAGYLYNTTSNRPTSSAFEDLTAGP